MDFLKKNLFLYVFWTTTNSGTMIDASCAPLGSSFHRTNSNETEGDNFNMQGSKTLGDIEMACDIFDYFTFISVDFVFTHNHFERQNLVFVPFPPFHNLRQCVFLTLLGIELVHIRGHIAGPPATYFRFLVSICICDHVLSHFISMLPSLIKLFSLVSIFLLCFSYIIFCLSLFWSVFLRALARDTSKAHVMQMIHEFVPTH